MNWDEYFAAIIKADNPKLLNDLINKPHTLVGRDSPPGNHSSLGLTTLDFLEQNIVRLIYDHDAAQILEALEDDTLDMSESQLEASSIKDEIKKAFRGKTDQINGHTGSLFKVKLGVLLEELTNEEIVAAIPLDDIDTVKYVLGKKATLFMWMDIQEKASKGDHVEILKLLYEGDSPKLKNNFLKSVVKTAAKANSPNVFRWAMEKMKSPNDFELEEMNEVKSQKMKNELKWVETLLGVETKWEYSLEILKIFIDLNPEWRPPSDEYAYDATKEGVAEKFLSLNPPVYPVEGELKNIKNFDTLVQILEGRPHYKVPSSQVNNAAKQGKMDFIYYTLRRHSTFDHDAKCWQLAKWKRENFRNYVPSLDEIMASLYDDTIGAAKWIDEISPYSRWDWSTLVNRVLTETLPHLKWLVEELEYTLRRTDMRILSWEQNVEAMTWIYSHVEWREAFKKAIKPTYLGSKTVINWWRENVDKDFTPGRENLLSAVWRADFECTKYLVEEFGINPDKEIMERARESVYRKDLLGAASVYEFLYDIKFSLPSKEEALKMLKANEHVRKWLMKRATRASLDRLVMEKAPIEILEYVLTTRNFEGLSEKVNENLETVASEAVRSVLKRYSFCIR